MNSIRIALILGDSSVILAVTWFGIRFHQTDPNIFSRLPYTFLPFLATWLLFAALLRFYELETAWAWSQLWRIPTVAMLATPVGAVVRTLWLGEDGVVLIFMIVFGAAMAVGILAFRSIFILAFRVRGSGLHRG